MNINEDGCWPCGMASALIAIGVSARYPDTVTHSFPLALWVVFIVVKDCSHSKIAIAIYFSQWFHVLGLVVMLLYRYAKTRSTIESH